MYYILMEHQCYVLMDHQCVVLLWSITLLYSNRAMVRLYSYGVSLCYILMEQQFVHILMEQQSVYILM